MNEMDNDLRQLRNLYSHVDVKLPLDFNFSKNRVKKEFDLLKRSHLKMLLAFVLTAAAIVYVDYVCSSKFLTSKSGFLILLFCSIYYSVLKLYLYSHLKAVDVTESVSDCIKKLENYNKTNNILQTYGEIIYVTLLSLGVYLYLQPFTFYINTTNKTAALTALKIVSITYLLWAIIYTFIIKRRLLNKETKVIERYLNQLKSSKDIS